MDEWPQWIRSTGTGRGGERDTRIRYGTYPPGVCRLSKGKSEQLTLRQGTKTTHGCGHENSENGQMPSSWRSLGSIHGGGGWLCTTLYVVGGACGATHESRHSVQEPKVFVGEDYRASSAEEQRA